MNFSEELAQKIGEKLAVEVLPGLDQAALIAAVVAAATQLAGLTDPKAVAEALRRLADRLELRAAEPKGNA